MPVALGTAASVVTDPGHVHILQIAGTGNAAAVNTAVFTSGWTGGVGNGSSSGPVLSATTGVTVATTITNGSEGQQPMSLVQPSLGVTWFIKT